MSEKTECSSLDSLESALLAFRRGEMIVVVDDDDRENEGDLIVAASMATPEQIAFMIRHTSGILCAPMTAENARRLHLDPMVAVNDAPLGTAFTVSVDYREGLTTGISAQERTACVRALANGNVGAADFVRPGHVFPLIAKQGGVLIRSGHTEAAVDLCQLSGLVPVGVLAELMNDDGTVKRGPEVLSFARQHSLKVISVADIIAFRQNREQLVERGKETRVETPAGSARGIFYTTPFDSVSHLALVFGDVEGGEDVPVRFHRENLLGDVFGTSQVLSRVYDVFKQEGRGVLVYLREGALGVPSVEESSSSQIRSGAWRDIGIGAQILKDLRVKSLTLLSTRERHYIGLCGFGVEIAKTRLLEDT